MQYAPFGLSVTLFRPRVVTVWYLMCNSAGPRRAEKVGKLQAEPHSVMTFVTLSIDLSPAISAV